MANDTRNQLKQAYNYIQQERLDEAISILRRVLSSEPDNADAWWLMANAVSDPADAAEALNNVLRVRPEHAEAREAYQQLIAEYPELAPAQTAEAALDVGEFNIDDLLAQAPTADAPKQRPARTEQDFGPTAWSMATADEAQDALDLDALFGGKASVDVPITATEEEDLTAVFGIEPAQTRFAAPDSPEPTFSETDAEFDALFSADAQPQETFEPTPDFAESTAEFDALFSTDAPTQASSAAETAPVASPPNLDADLDAIFSGEPAFVGQIDEQQEQRRGRRGRRRREPQPTTFEEAYGEPEPLAATQPAAPKPERSPKPRRLAPEQPAYDPFEAERRANKRSPVWRILGLLVAVGAVVLLAFLVAPSLAPDPVTQALRNAQDSLSANGFAQAAANREGDVFRLTVCGSASRALQNRVYQAMELIADHVAAAGEQIKAVQLTVTDCANQSVVLYRATAPVDAVRRYLDSGKMDVRTYRASWQ
ncbi:MAG: hypothetical protein CUN49_00715 [Candidatus Thermofonsia Clade 1 bacterium]|jgi:hypothetical protein|uniref:Uncharacterized protein n=1 Tax=Candidatus Thermofonsia Clade 1 bacterium TaxID=2364210 RepID=A0A2M8PII8_9CHLR|nr:MAG: hypothetical protein CUN49_00715 [Candidatus Thermofonsia Clade 1 bacterium]RMF50785.1 MAG: hypothetical protein D6749_09595 [Chloroflexota bacterium]